MTRKLFAKWNLWRDACLANRPIPRRMLELKRLSRQCRRGWQGRFWLWFYDPYNEAWMAEHAFFERIAQELKRELRAMTSPAAPRTLRQSRGDCHDN